MTATTPAKHRAPTRPTRGARRGGYVAAAAINLAILWVLFVAPGWGELNLLTDEFVAITGVLTVSLVAGVIANAVYVVTDPPWVKRIGDAVTAALACAVLVRTWMVFPFELTGGWATWDTTVRAVVGFIAVATAIGVLANLAGLVQHARAAGTAGADAPGAR